VLPKDKREVVLVLRNIYHQVIGMTGDGVNDAPALSAAQCGIAVDDATDAAKNAAAIILTSPGLSAIYSAVVESRRIFRKLKAYVTYRFAATIQIVIVLTLLIFISDCPINPTFVIILALFNDLTMLPIAYDNQQASSLPEDPNVIKMLSVSFALGVLETVFSLIFAYAVMTSNIFKGDYNASGCSTPTQALIWLQIFIAAEFLIFSTRAPKYIPISLPPSIALFSSVMIGCLVASIMAGSSSTFGSIAVVDIVLVWVYDFLGLCCCDVLKVNMFNFFKENTNVLPELVETGSISDKPAKKHGHGGSDIEAGTVENKAQEEDVSRASMSANRMTNWAMENERMSSIDPSMRPSVANKQKRMSSVGMQSYDASKARESLSSMNGRISLSQSGQTDLRPNYGANIRPNVPANRAKY